MSARYNVPDLSLFFDEGVKKGKTHMIVMYQQTGVTNGVQDWNDQHYYVDEGQDPRAVIRTLPGRAMEVYNLRLPKEPQLKEYCAANF